MPQHHPSCRSRSVGRHLQRLGLERLEHLGRLVPRTSGNAGGRPKPPDCLRTRLAELSPRAVERLAELLDSTVQRIQRKAAKVILDRHMGRPAIQADLTLRTGTSANHLQALIEVARKRSNQPIVLGERALLDVTPVHLDDRQQR